MMSDSRLSNIGWRMVEGDARAALLKLPARSVQCCVTSPPFYALRDYGHAEQIGLEPTPDEYAAALVDVFREVRRVLADDGTLWLNLGDSYAMRAQGRGQMVGSHDGFTGRASRPSPKRRMSGDLKNKDLIGIPWLVAFALRADGWYLRSDVIWHKPNPMPESVTDRPTGAHEYLFLLSKAERYFYDAAAIKEPATDTGRVNGRDGRVEDERARPPGSRARTLKRLDYSVRGRNKRDVWTIPTSRYRGAHFATFPPALVEPCILAGSKPGDTVLDPFAGAATTGVVALRHDRSFIGVELNPEYAALARDRIQADAPLLNVEAVA